MDRDDQSVESAVEELERSARSVARLAENLRASPELLASAEVKAAVSSAEALSAEARLADPSAHDD